MYKIWKKKLKLLNDCSYGRVAAGLTGAVGKGPLGPEDDSRDSCFGGQAQSSHVGPGSASPRGCWERGKTLWGDRSDFEGFGCADGKVALFFFLVEILVLYWYCVFILLIFLSGRKKLGIAINIGFENGKNLLGLALAFRHRGIGSSKLW